MRRLVKITCRVRIAIHHAHRGIPPAKIIDVKYDKIRPLRGLTGASSHDQEKSHEKFHVLFQMLFTDTFLNQGCRSFLPGFIFPGHAGFSKGGSSPAGCRHGDELVFAVRVTVVEEFLDGLGTGFNKP